jgi:hypothetical protein
MPYFWHTVQGGLRLYLPTLLMVLVLVLMLTACGKKHGGGY